MVSSYAYIKRGLRPCSATAFQVAFSVLAELKLYFFKNSMFGKIAYQINFRVSSSWLKTLLSLTFHKTLLAFTPAIPILPLKFFHIYIPCHWYKSSSLSPKPSLCFRNPPPLLQCYCRSVIAGTSLPARSVYLPSLLQCSSRRCSARCSVYLPVPSLLQCSLLCSFPAFFLLVFLSLFSFNLKCRRQIYFFPLVSGIRFELWNALDVKHDYLKGKCLQWDS